jgi:hypothetical protein
MMPLLPDHYSRYLHLCHGAKLQSIHLNQGRAEISVPAGEVEIFLARGPEFIPLTERVEIGAGATVGREYVLRKRLDLAARNWYGGDMHTHFSLAVEHEEYL